MSLPHAVELELRNKHVDYTTVTDVFEMANNIEEELLRRHGRLPEPLVALPAMPAAMDDGHHAKAKATQGGKRCGCCGLTGHFKKDCPKRNYRCANCSDIGHLRAMCRNTIERDEYNRIISIIRPKPSQLEVVEKRDNTLKDKLVSATRVMNVVKEVSQQRAEIA